LKSGGISGGNMHSRELLVDNVAILTLDARAGYFGRCHGCASREFSSGAWSG
jgi:hypothetical protein